MKSRIIIGLFLCVALAQVVTPLSMIATRESVIKNGAQFKFKTAPIDPYDAFRGRYVALQIEGDYVPTVMGVKLTHGESVYALIDIDSEGFAKFTSVLTKRPREKPYMQAKVRHISGDKVYLDLPIDRYYMEEKSAPIAERIYRRHTQRNRQDAYVVVRIKDGFAVIENLFVGGQKIEDAVKKERKS
ncbi:MAG: GDYXXLXY domain-containing protein [Candidatus Omnitrophota bacterium]